MKEHRNCSRQWHDRNWDIHKNSLSVDNLNWTIRFKKYFRPTFGFNGSHKRLGSYTLFSEFGSHNYYINMEFCTVY
jgi:hypothetical protein